MARDNPITIKKYANRRLYHTGTSTYVTLDDLAEMVRRGEDFVVQDAKTGEDITRAVLGQIIFEHENRGPHLLPIAFLRQLIRFYGDNMQALVPTYLETSLSAFTRDQDKLRDQMAKAMKGDALGAFENQAKRNMELFSEALKMWIPFPGAASEGEANASAKPEKPEDREADIETLRNQLRDMQQAIDTIANKK